ncbi:unknown [Clostridium sp. CAG:780]|nr:unknown [Clostridium sp. CAG:780]
MILGATDSIEEKEFYIRMCIKNNYILYRCFNKNKRKRKL